MGEVQDSQWSDRTVTAERSITGQRRMMLNSGALQVLIALKAPNAFNIAHVVANYGVPRRAFHLHNGQPKGVNNKARRKS